MQKVFEKGIKEFIKRCKQPDIKKIRIISKTKKRNNMMKEIDEYLRENS